jgi:hypothetical protein
MPNPSEAPGSSCERPSSVLQRRPNVDRDLANMLLDSREIPRTLPIELAALVADLVEAVRARKILATSLGIADRVIIAVTPRHEPQVDLGYIAPSEQPQ